MIINRIHLKKNAFYILVGYSNKRLHNCISFCKLEHHKQGTP